MNRDLTHAIRGAFRNPRELCALLGVEQNAKRQTAGGVTICCPLHAERTPSCSVTNGPDGTVRFRCFGCDQGGDALTLIAAVRGLDLKGQFREVLEAAAELGGLWRELDELRGGNGATAQRTGQPERSAPSPAPERPYPPSSELLTLWERANPVTGDRFAVAELERRGLDASTVASADLVRVIAGGLPHWARYQGKSWNETGHRMIMRAFDCEGELRSVRAWRIHPGDSPKRLPPAGFKASGLVLANRGAIAMLKREPCHRTIIVVEGEPDALVRMVVNQGFPVLGVGSGSWHAGFAERVPYGSEVVVRTHRDRAGDGYAMKVLESVRHRAQVCRLQVDHEGEAA